MSRKVLIGKMFVFIAIFIQFNHSLYAAPQEESRLAYVEGEMLVRFAPKPNGKQQSLTEKNQIISSLSGGYLERNYRLVPGLTLVKLPEDLKVKDILGTFNRDDRILYAEPSYKMQWFSNVPNDPCFPWQWGLHNTGQLHPSGPLGQGEFSSGTPNADIDAPQAWDIHTSTEVIVAVIDSGVDYTHPDLAENMWINQSEYSGSPSIDDDNNGYVDDIYGYDFFNNDGDPIDDRFHGTHCAGIIGSVGNNSVGVTGVCWNVKIMALKCGDSSGPDVSAAIDAIEYAVENDAKVLSNSWGSYSYTPQSLEDAIEAANAAGVLFVAAAGNENVQWPAYPALYDCENIISVLATDHNDQKCSFSSWSENSVDLGAPGEDILSTFPTYKTQAMNEYGLSKYYEVASGTSMATPCVAGACALAWSMNPQLSHLQVKQIILDSVDKLDSLENDPQYCQLCVTGGRLNLHKALIEAAKGRQSLSVVADVNNGCVAPFDVNEQNYLVYDIYWDANGFADTNSFITDYLPDDLDYYSSDPPVDYNQTDHTVTWSLGNIIGTDSGSVQITTKVNKLLCPCSKIENTVIFKGDSCYNQQLEEVMVCHWGPDIIYINDDVNDPNSSYRGTNWEDAYKSIQDAFDIVSNCPNSFNKIWVASGTYKPVNEADCHQYYKDKSFELLSNFALIGHFAGSETNPYQRDLADANNETILDSLIETGKKVEKVVTAEGIDNSLIDGFTIKSAKGVYVNDSNLAIVNCKFLYNSNGIYCENSSELDIHNCLFIENSFSGLYVKDNDSNTIVSNCIFEGSESANEGVFLENSYVELNHCRFKNLYQYGIHGINCNLTIKDCNVQSTHGDYYPYGIYSDDCNLLIERSIIHNNGGGGDLSGGLYSNQNLILKENIFRNNNGNGIKIPFDYPVTIVNNWIHNNTESGIHFIYPISDLTLRNNTIFANEKYGIYLNMGSMSSEILNCIIYDNNNGDFSGSFTNVKYCCLEDGDLGETSNITANPDFMNIGTDPNDLHISENSPCKDTGDSNSIPTDEIDIDGEGRIKYGEVDMGADEYYWSPADFDFSGFVDFIDYAILANAFRCTSEEPNYVEKCDLEDNNCIDCNDLKSFCEDWLWEKAWETGWMMCMGGGGDGKGSGLMLDLQQSLIARPERLAARSDKFYAVNVYKTTAEKTLLYIDENVIEEILAWFDKIWLETDEFRKVMTEKEFLEFRKAVEQDLLRFLKGY